MVEVTVIGMWVMSKIECERNTQYVEECGRDIQLRGELERRVQGSENLAGKLDPRSLQAWTESLLINNL